MGRPLHRRCMPAGARRNLRVFASDPLLQCGDLPGVWAVRRSSLRVPQECTTRSERHRWLLLRTSSLYARAALPVRSVVTEEIVVLAAAPVPTGRGGRTCECNAQDRWAPRRQYRSQRGRRTAPTRIDAYAASCAPFHPSSTVTCDAAVAIGIADRWTQRSTVVASPTALGPRDPITIPAAFGSLHRPIAHAARRAARSRRN
jgi:hypothetical protein